jgi:hypothetical protein
MLTVLKGLIKGAIIGALATFLLMLVGLYVLLGPLMIPFLIVLLVLGGLGVLDYKCVIKPICGGIVGLFRKVFDAIRKVVAS